MKGQKRKRSVVRRTLNILEILQKAEYGAMWAICDALSRCPSAVADGFVSAHYLESSAVRTAICSAISTVDFGAGGHWTHRAAASCGDAPSARSLTAVLLLAVPFVASSGAVQAALCRQYVVHWDGESGSALCRGLVFALKLRVSVVALSVKRWIARTLCLVLEDQHRLKLSLPIKDAFGGLVACSLQIVQCERAWSHSHGFRIAEYAARILLCEVSQGVMARQGLKEHATNLIVLQTVNALHQHFEADNASLSDVECRTKFHFMI